MSRRVKLLIVGTTIAGLVAVLAPAGAEARASIMYSTSAARLNPTVLDGREFASGELVYIFATTNGPPVLSVEFHVDGGRWFTDRAAPYDLRDSPPEEAKPVNTRDLGVGVHSLRIVVTTASDQIESTATFAVATTVPPTTTTVPPTTTSERDPYRWPFSSTSPWNTAIGSGAQYSSSGAAITKNLLDPAVTPWINAARYSHPFLRSTSSDPVVAVNWRYAVFPPYNNGTTSYKIPADARPAAGVDAHLHILDPDGRTVRETFQMAGSGSTRTAFKYAEFDLYGSGLGNAPGVNSGSRAYGGSAVGGLVRGWELAAGSIQHALALTLTNDQLRSGYVWPATSQDSGGTTDYAGEVPMGSLVAIPASVNINNLGLSTSGRVMARALQDYGAYVVDRGSAFTFYAEPSAESALSDIRQDMAKLRAALRVVLNNTPGSVGGGGTPRRPAAPEL